ncbi:hypothetical protein MCOR25_007309 [Pyricularia grisea]|uniref:ADP-ribosylation factor GTPase-activating protein n=1 Tax=Pyricularia grisea TaxID=148305 RepID=A0A6P8BC85_PYRGI|nr:uncharacterized protein PgNI_03901 [Pyricularia grisea]KAI6358433.1 hypothetical protein MCOR25_007309 [Pyricularia grisea]TLD13302.1 hypothetical protein PgNI_03901 [Pyricularia grisea]
MGNVTSRPEEAAALYLRDQNRLSISSVVVSSPRKRSSINIVPNAFPATRFSASRSLGDSSPVEFVQDPETISSGGPPQFIIKFNSDDELNFNFTFVIRQTPGVPSPTSAAGLDVAAGPASNDTHVNNLTFVYASSAKEVENLVTREFHADPNLHKNSNVELVGDYSTDGSPSISFEWSWRWKPPKIAEDKGGGWRNSCSFVEYDQRGHRLVSLASFAFWVSNSNSYMSQPSSPSPQFLLHAPPRIRVASSQSVESRISAADINEPASPRANFNADSPSDVLPPPSTASSEPVKVDVACPRPGEDVAVTDDGPVFRATIKALEQKTGSMRTQMKRLIKKAEHAQTTQAEANEAFMAFVDALKEASATNTNAVQPAIDHYFDKIAREILFYERQNAANLQRMIIEPLNRLYTMDIKQAEAKKRDFEEESKDYYAYVGKYLGQRSDSVKTKKLVESDNKYQGKRRNFELKRFDYSSFMQDLSGGRKEQEVLSHLTKYADAQTKGFLSTAKKVEALLPQLEALSNEVQEADKEYQYQRREREEKRRVLEKSNGAAMEPETPLTTAMPSVTTPLNGNTNSDSELGRADSTGSQLRTVPNSTTSSSTVVGDLSKSPGSFSHSSVNVGSPPPPSKFKGIRDLEERDPSQSATSDKYATQRKEGLLWSLSRPGGHVDPRAALNKQTWHKFWIVLDQGKLSEYSNWKQKLDLHMDPIDLRMASVREARNAERRFCFEVITPQFKRVYQATSEEDMNSWITSINNALQSAVEGRGVRDKPVQSGTDQSASFRRDIGSILTGKSPSLGHGHAANTSSSGFPTRRITVGGGAPSGHRVGSTGSQEENPDKLLQALRENDQGNLWCADCGSGSKVEWVSLNLAIILCIECSGIHRSLGTHISKIRSLTLDITSFRTPDIVELLMLVGNRVANMIWEARLDHSIKPGPHATREQRLKFITMKYVDRAFVDPLSPTTSRYLTADETLLAAIKRNEIQQVIYALALRANPNVTDRSRGTHAIFLALAAADPASPSPVPVSTANARVDGERTTPFPVAELLTQNGAEIPSTMPAFPLSRSAQQYLEGKRCRSASISMVGSQQTVSSTIQDLTQATADKLAREREARLQKRVSAGGRLAKSPIPER